MKQIKGALGRVAWMQDGARAFAVATMACLCVLASAAAFSQEAEAAFSWEPIFQGVELTSHRVTEPLPLAIYAVRIDLQAPGLSFVVTPPNGEEPEETNSRTTSTFAEELGCQVAINASPFSPVVGEEGVPQDVVGVSIADGERYSDPQPDWAALLIGPDNRAWCAQQSEDMSAARHGVGGFGRLLDAGRNVGDGNDIHPRTAAGVSEGGRYLIWAVIDGRQPDHSVGASTAETAEWMRRLGCHDAVNLDGGGSTTLVVTDAEGVAKPVNRPIHANVPGTERPSANHIGVRAQALGSVALEGSEPAEAVK